MTEDPIAKLHERLDGSVPPGLKPQPGDYVELVDESDPDGPVQVCRKDGTLVMMMPQQAFLEMRAKGQADHERKVLSEEAVAKIAAALDLPADHVRREFMAAAREHGVDLVSERALLPKPPTGNRLERRRLAAEARRAKR